MKKILVAAQWNVQDITKSWSGTSYQLYKHIERYREVERLYIPNNFSKRILCKANNLCLQNSFMFKKFIHKYEHYELQKQIKDSSLPVLSIGSIRTLKNPTYIYVDNLFCSCLLLDKFKEEGWGYNPWGNLGKKYIEQAIKYEHNVIRKSQAVFCMGEWLADLAKKTYEDCSNKIFTAPGGINSIAKQQDDRKITDMVLFVGRDFERKAGDIVVEAVKYLNEKRLRPVKLCIVGPSQYPLIEKYEWIDFRGDISYEKVGELMMEAQVFCMPSRFEAYGLVFAEALVAGTPCIGRNAFEMPYFINEGITGELLECDNYKELAEKIDKILTSSEYIQNVKNRKQEISTKYSWEKTAHQIMDIIN